MSSRSISTPESESEFLRNAAIAEAVEQARREHREVDIASLAAAHDMQPHEVEASIEALRALDAISAGLQAEADSDSFVESAGAARELGDYRLVRKIGHGGMGVVYEARDRSIDRRVAIKILPFACAHDERRLQRFQREARAAGRLEHPHIVPVYAVGRSDGVPYYVMKLIEGENLSQRMERLREHPDRDAILASESHIRAGVEIARQAADALAHAHERGVIHRDVKPSNWILDAEDRVWITDFGLALLDHGSTDTERGVESSAAPPEPTRTGDVLGTLQYMSPEQASGRRDVDARTDVYGVGASLYEWLTLARPIEGNDRADLLRRIASDEPKRLRRHGNAIPRDLETIVMRAIARDPADRYASAGDLADDLERFASGRPIHARPPTTSDRALRFARRHRIGIVAAGVGSLLLIACLTAFTYLLWQERMKAEAERARATEHFRRAREAVDRLLTGVADESLAGTPRSEALRRELLEEAARYYESFLASESRTPELLREASLSQGRLGKIYELLDRFEDAERALRQSIAWHEELLVDADDLAAPRLRKELARVWNNLGVTLHRAGHLPQAADAYAQSVALKSDLAEIDPSDLEIRIELARSLANLGIVYEQSGRLREARDTLERARARKERLHAEYPENAEYRDELAVTWTSLARLHETEGRIPDAIDHLNRAIELWRDRPSDTNQDREALLAAIGQRGTCYAKLYQGDAARRDLDEAIAGFVAVSDEHPDVPELRAALAMHLSNRGLLAAQQSDLVSAEDFVGRAIEIREALLEESDGSPLRQRDLAESLHHLGDVLSFAGRIEEAEARYLRAIELRHAVAEAFPDDARHGYPLAALEAALAVLARRRGDIETERSAWRRSASAFEALVDQVPTRAEYRDGLARALHELTRLAYDAGRLSEARDHLRRIVLLRESLLDDMPDDPTRRRQLADARNDLAWMLLFAIEPTAAGYREARRLSEGAIELAPEVSPFWTTLGIARCRDGDARGAIEALEHSMETGGAPEAQNRLLLSLSHLNAGDRVEARRHLALAKSALQAPVGGLPGWVLDLVDEIERTLPPQTPGEDPAEG